MKIVIADDLPASAIEALQVAGWTVDTRAGRPASTLPLDVADADALIVRSATRVDRALIDAAPALKVIARAGTGVDNVDVGAASARGILVMNAPGANSVSVAEHTCALMLALARSIPAADAAMKRERWDKKAFTGAELRDKVLGIIGLGRVGQEVAHRAHGFGMEVVAHDPFISSQVASDLGVELDSIDRVCARADVLTLHVPSTAGTRALFGAERLARCKPGVLLINTARGDLIDERALIDALQNGQVAGAALDVFQTEPPADWRLISLPQVIATPHIAASTREAQELVGVETACAVRDYLRDGIVRNAVNFPSVSPEESRRLAPFTMLGERLGTVLSIISEGRTEAVGIRYYGELAEGGTELVSSAVLVGLLRPMLSTGVTPVNARALAAGRGVEVVESRSSRHRHYASVVSIKLHTSTGQRVIEGAVFEHGSPRLVLLDGVPIEAPLEGTLMIMTNDDQPGVIGQVGSILGRHQVNIANFALGRSAAGATGIVNIDDRAGGRAETVREPGVMNDQVMQEIREVPAVRAAWLVRL